MNGTSRPVKRLFMLSLDQCDTAYDLIRSTAPTSERRRALKWLAESQLFISSKLGRGSFFWRARKCLPEGFSNERELWCPPAGVASVGRINRRGEPCLYLSSRKETALAEIYADTGDFVQLSAFRVKPGQSLHVLTVGEWLHIQRTGRSRIFAEAQAEAIDSTLNSFPYDYARSLIYVDSIFGSIMADQEASRDDYALTRELAQQAFGKVPAANSLLYPSVQLSNGMNLAIKSAAAAESVESVASFVARVERKRRFGTFELAILNSATGVDTDCNYHWKPVDNPREYFLYRLTAEERTLKPGSVRDLLQGMKQGQLTLRDNPANQNE